MRKILIVEDDTLLNKTLAYNLASEGYETVSAFTYASAVAHLQKNEFDLVLLDINLPDGSGLDLCEEIRTRGQNSYIMFLTANDKESDMLGGYEAGGADYITKPFPSPCCAESSPPSLPTWSGGTPGTTCTMTAS